MFTRTGKTHPQSQKILFMALVLKLHGKVDNKKDVLIKLTKRPKGTPVFIADSESP